MSSRLSARTSHDHKPCSNIRLPIRQTTDSGKVFDSTMLYCCRHGSLELRRNTAPHYHRGEETRPFPIPSLAFCQAEFTVVVPKNKSRSRTPSTLPLFYRTLNGAQVVDLFMSLIHTCQLCDTNSMPDRRTIWLRDQGTQEPTLAGLANQTLVFRSFSASMPRYEKVDPTRGGKLSKFDALKATNPDPAAEANPQ